VGCRGFCAVLPIFFIANNGGAKKHGALLGGELENMGGVYTAVTMLFIFMQERQGVRISPDFPDLDRQDAGQGWGISFAVKCHVFALPEPGFFVPVFAGDFL
jgi:hypothetical protein